MTVGVPLIVELKEHTSQMSNVHDIVRAPSSTAVSFKNGPATPATPPTPSRRTFEPQRSYHQQPLLKQPHTSSLPTPDSSPSHGRTPADHPRSQPPIGESEQRDAPQAKPEEAPLEISSSVAPNLRSSKPSPARRTALETSHRSWSLRNPASVRRLNSAFKLIKELNERKSTLRGGELYTFRKLFPKEYQDLQKKLESDPEDLLPFFEETLRYNYSATYKRLTICMPGPCHVSMTEQLTDSIKTWYRNVARETLYVDGHKVTCTGATCRAAASIKSYGETKVLIKRNRAQSDLEADGSFRYGYGDIPHVILEVSWAQKPDDLLKKCNDWIRQSDGAVRTIIAFDLHDIYSHIPAPLKQNSRKAENLNQGKVSFCVWRRDVNRGLMDRKEFKEILRDENNRLVTDHTLRLELRDFIPPTSREDDLENLELVFDSLKLSSMVHEALNMQSGGSIDNNVTSIAPQETQPLPSPIQSTSPEPTNTSAPLAGSAQNPSLGTETAQADTAATSRIGWLSLGRLRLRRGR